MSRRGLEERLAAVEARQRAYEMHDLGCPAFVSHEPSSLPGLFGFLRDSCACWLADPTKTCLSCGHPWKQHDGHRSCFHGARPTGEFSAELACMCREIGEVVK